MERRRYAIQHIESVIVPEMILANKTHQWLRLISESLHVILLNQPKPIFSVRKYRKISTSGFLESIFIQNTVVIQYDTKNE
jgi:hypothetical protein